MYDNTLWSFATWSLNYLAVIEEVAALNGDHSPVTVNIEISINYFPTYLDAIVPLVRVKILGGG